MYCESRGAFPGLVVLFVIAVVCRAYFFLKDLLVAQYGTGVVVNKYSIDNRGEDGSSLVNNETGFVTSAVLVFFVVIRKDDDTEQEFRIRNKLVKEVKKDQELSFLFREGILGPKIIKIFAVSSDEEYPLAMGSAIAV